MNALDFLYNAFSAHYETKIQPIAIENNEHTCSECERAIADTSHPHEHVFIAKNSYGLPRIRCLACQMLYVGNEELLGGFIKLKSAVYVARNDQSKTLDIIKNTKGKKKIDAALKQEKIKTYTEKQFLESRSCTVVYIAQNQKVYVHPSAVAKTMKLIKTENPSKVRAWLKTEGLLLTSRDFKNSIENDPIVECLTGGNWEEKKMNSMAGVGIVIHNEGIEFYASGEHFQRLNRVDNFPYKLHPFAGGLIFKDIVTRFRNIRPLLVIETFGSCKEDFIHNLQLSTQPEEIVLCRDKDVIKINLDAYDAMINLLKKEDKKTIKEFSVNLYRYCVGSTTPAEFIAQCENIKGVSEVMGILPSDPHEIINLKNIVEKELI